MTHWTSTTLAWKALWNFGAATLTTVPSIKAMLEPRIVAARIHGPEFSAQRVPGLPERMEISSQGAFMQVLSSQGIGSLGHSVSLVARSSCGVESERGARPAQAHPIRACAAPLRCPI